MKLEIVIFVFALFAVLGWALVVTRMIDACTELLQSKAKLLDAQRFEILLNHNISSDKMTVLKNQGWKIFA